MSMNKVCLIGKIVKEVELKTTRNDKALCSFSLGVPRNYKKKGERYAEQDMIACRVWEESAQRLARYTSKGDWIAVVGRLCIDRYEKNGEKKSFAYVLCDEVDFIRSHGADWASGIASKQSIKKNTDTGNAFDDMGEVQLDIGDW